MGEDVTLVHTLVVREINLPCAIRKSGNLINGMAEFDAGHHAKVFGIALKIGL